MADKETEPKKFQTRVGISRKTKEEREQYARDEAARQQQKLAEAVQTPAINVLGRGGPSGRGRVSAVSSSTNRVRSENTGGVFGAAAPSLPKPRSGRHASAASVASEEVEQSAHQEPSKGASTSAHKTKTKTVDLGNESSMKTEKKPLTRTKATASRAHDTVDLSSGDDFDDGARRDIEQIWISSDEEAVSSTTKGKQRESRPARHGTALRPLRAPRDSRVEGEAISARNRAPATVKKGKDSKDGVRGPAAKDDMAMNTSDKMLPPSAASPDKKSSKRKGARLKDAIAPTETAEEYAERLRYNEEVRKLVGELNRGQSPTKDTSSQTFTTDGPQDRRLYLFQFPPMTPVLVDPDAIVDVKQESEVEVLLGLEKTNGTIIKKEEGTAEKPKKSDVLTADNMQLPSGLAGTLRVHKSGKVTLDWGGTDMEVRYGTEVDFLQDVVMTDETEQTAWALGQVEKKMICIPNWQKLYE
jgi:RNA polymerase III RPC4